MSADDDEQERLRRALRAPGDPSELSEEERYRAMFRAEHSPAAPVTRRRSRARGRLAAGGAAAVVLALGTGGVAAAYSGRLPAPIQSLAHHVIGAPEATRPPAARSTSAPRAPRPSSAPRAGASPSPSGSPAPRRSPEPRRTASPTAAATGTTSAVARPSSSPAPSSSPTATSAPAPVLTGVTAVGSSHRADIGARVRFSGRLSYSGTPATRRSMRPVVLQQQSEGRWTAVGKARPDVDGGFTLVAPTLDRTRTFRVLARQGSVTERSSPWRVAMHPLVTADVSTARTRATIRVSALGGTGGDQVTLLTRRDGRPVVVGRARLDSAGTASFAVTPERRRTTYRVVLDATGRHTSAQVAVVVTLAR